jgi:hypothetical protein
MLTVPDPRLSYASQSRRRLSARVPGKWWRRSATNAVGRGRRDSSVLARSQADGLWLKRGKLGSFAAMGVSI